MAGSTFVFHNPRVERIVSGPGAIGKLAEEVERLGGKRALVVTSPSVAKTFLLGRITSVLGAKLPPLFKRRAGSGVGPRLCCRSFRIFIPKPSVFGA